MRMRGSIPARQGKMTVEQYQETRRRQREEMRKQDAERSAEQQGGVDERIAPRIFFGAGQPVPDEVPQSTGD